MCFFFPHNSLFYRMRIHLLLLLFPLICPVASTIGNQAVPLSDVGNNDLDEIKISFLETFSAGWNKTILKKLAPFFLHPRRVREYLQNEYVIYTIAAFVSYSSADTSIPLGLLDLLLKSHIPHYLVYDAVRCTSEECLPFGVTPKGRKRIVANLMGIAASFAALGFPWESNFQNLIMPFALIGMDPIMHAILERMSESPLFRRPQ